jgi:hypothetical protein
MIPRAGSAYTYGYVALGELVGWFIGWDLLEYIADWPNDTVVKVGNPESSLQ